MFKELADLAKTTSIHLIITAASETELQVAVLPQSKEGVNPALCQPLILTATPAELDEKFVPILTDYKAARKSLEESLEDAKLVMEAAGKSARDKATTATKTATTPAAAPAVKQEEKPAEPASGTDAANDDDDLTLF